MLKHGENIIDTLGAEVDRLEKELKVRYIHYDIIAIFWALTLLDPMLIASLVYSLCNPWCVGCSGWENGGLEKLDNLFKKVGGLGFEPV